MLEVKIHSSNAEIEAGIKIFAEACKADHLVPVFAHQHSAHGLVKFGIGKSVPVGPRPVLKAFEVLLSHQFVTDLPGTRKYQDALGFFLRCLSMRIRNPESSDYLTLSGIPLKLDIDWPFEPSYNSDTSYVHIHTHRFPDGKEANFSLSASGRVRMIVTSLAQVVFDPFVVNAIRKSIDIGTAVFFDQGKHPTDLQQLVIRSDDYNNDTKRFEYANPDDSQIKEFLKRKVYWLGFQRGDRETAIWIADPYDADYLSTSPERLIRFARILDAEGFLRVSDDGQFATPTPRLVKESTTFEQELRDSTDSSGGVRVPTPNLAGAQTVTRSAAKIVRARPRTYRLLGVIGQGAKGVVREVQDEGGETFALKELRPEFVGKQAEQRFFAEQRFCWLSDHPNIIRVLDFGTAIREGIECPFYVTRKYASSLRQLIRKEINQDDLLHYFLQIVSGVAEAHRCRVWHRDLKPENVLCDPASRRVVLADFGIAHFDEPPLADHVETRSGELLANRAYCAPEQHVKGSSVGPSADIFALGRILNEMFTGQIPIGSNFPMIGSIAPSFAYLDELVDGMLNQDPDSRPTIEDVWHGVARGPGDSLEARVDRRRARALELSVPSQREDALFETFALAKKVGLLHKAVGIALEFRVPARREDALWQVFEAYVSSEDIRSAEQVAELLGVPTMREEAKRILFDME